MPSPNAPEAVRKRTKGRTVFRPEVFSHKAPCPNPACRRSTFLKICPNCGWLLPSISGDSVTMTIAGLRGSGKSNYIASLYRLLTTELTYPDTFSMSCRVHDDAGQQYFEEKIAEIVEVGSEPTQLHGEQEEDDQHAQTPVIQMTVKFPKWEKGRANPNKMVVSPLILHDPAGEWFESLDNIYQTNFLQNTRSLILLLNPLKFPRFTPEKPQVEQEFSESSDPLQALKTLTELVRNQTGQIDESVKLAKDLAVVISKADCGVFGDDPIMESLRLQTQPYDMSITDEFSEICKQRLRELGVPEIVTQAENDYENVRFFAVSSLGNSRQPDGTVDPRLWKSKRVEDPFLWILHSRGFL